MKITLRRNDAALIEVARFDCPDTSKFARLVISAPIIFDGDELKAIEASQAFIGVRRSDFGPLETDFQIDSSDGKTNFSIELSPRLLFAALDIARPVRLSHASRKLDIEITVTAIRSGNPKPIDPEFILHRYRPDNYELAFGLEVTRPLPNQAPKTSVQTGGLHLVSILQIRREDRGFSSSDFSRLRGQAERATPPTIEIDIEQGAKQRFKSEALLAFSAAPHVRNRDDEAGPTIYLELNVADDSRAPHRLIDHLFLSYATDVTSHSQSGKKEITEWELSPMSRSSRYRLSVAQVYAVCLNLSKLDFEVERLFGSGDALAFDLNLYLSVEDADPFERRRVQLSLVRPQNSFLLVSTPRGDRAVVIAVGQGGSHRINVEAPAHEAERSSASIRMYNLGANEEVFSFQPKIAHADQITLAPGKHVQRSIDGDATVTIAGTSLLVMAIAPTKSKILAVDIGTMAIAMATASIHDNNVHALRLGQIVTERLELNGVQSVPGQSIRREMEHKDLISSLFGITTLSDVRQFELPIQCRGAKPLDYRMNVRPLGTGSHDRDLQERLRLTTAPLEIHLPLTDRKYEMGLASLYHRFGIAPVAALKMEICTREKLNADASLTTRAVDGLTTNANWPRTRLSQVSTETALAAVLDTLVVAYSPAGIDDPEAAAYDWDLVMTYPASIGADARERYRRALAYIVERQQKAAQLRGRQGRMRLQLVPESVAACWALLVSGRLWQNEDAKYRRLVLFDIGAGTLDVSAMDILVEDHGEQILGQTVSFSVPLGGDVLDRAIAHDLLSNPIFTNDGYVNDEKAIDSDLLSRIDTGKRVSTSHPAFSKSDFLPINTRRGTAGIRPPPDFSPNSPISGNVNVIRLATFKSGLADPLEGWVSVDLQKPPAYFLQAYHDVISKLIVEPTLEAIGGPGDANSERRVAVEVVVSGRAAFFRPLLGAIEDSVRRTFKGEVSAKLASEVLMYEDKDAADGMKGIVAKGAAIWSREMSRRGAAKTIEQPPHAVHLLASFAVFIGHWDAKYSSMIEIGELKGIKVGMSEFTVPDDPADPDAPKPPEPFAYLVTRPPFIAKRHIKAVQDDYAVETGENAKAGLFAMDLIDRCLRPIALKNLTDIARAGSPMPYRIFPNEPESRILEIHDGVRLAGKGQRVTLDCTVTGNGVIKVAATVDGGPKREWQLSSTFMYDSGPAE